jgi:TorA maturation chaperone TorD
MPWPSPYSEAVMIDDLKEELSLFNLLRQVFLKEPPKELVEGISKVDLPSDADDEISYGLKLMIETVRKNSHRQHEWTEELAVEYARLFVGPKNPPAIPYASFYLSELHSLMTDETIDVRKRYLDAGMAVKELYSVPDDHIGIELEFIYYLTQETLKLYERGAREEASRLFEIRSDFLKGHMALWVPFFAEKIIESTGEDFYKGAAYMLKACVG